MNKRNYIAAMLVAASLLSGCTVAGKQVFFSFTGSFTVFSIGPLSCGRTEAKVYLANYKNLYGKVGDTDLWSDDFDTEADFLKWKAWSDENYHAPLVYEL